ncbi:MAG: helix-turn-helix transcriptional regulator [Clostridia bacterium]|nr:helix-turn-helix transcriptional regulator [Clostridia bacterium]
MQKKQSARQEKKRFPDGFRVLQGKQEFITYPEYASIRVWASDKPGKFEMHMHSAVEIILPHRGVSVYRLEDREYHVEPDEVLIIPANLPHELVEQEGILRYLILFEPSPLFSLQDMQQVSGIMQHPIHLKDQSEVHGQVSRILHQLVDCYFQHKPMWNTQCYSYLLQAYALLAAQFVEASTADEEDDQRSIDPEIMNMAINYLSDHYMEDITLDEVAAFTGYSKYYFSRAFKNYFSISYSDYLLVKRINAAVNLLIHTDKPIGEVAKEAGFGSIATFNRVFRQHKKCTPTRYRAIYGQH